MSIASVKCKNCFQKIKDETYEYVSDPYQPGDPEDEDFYFCDRECFNNWWKTQIICSLEDIGNSLHRFEDYLRKEEDFT